MARPLRIQEAGLMYHVTARGNGRMDIFLDDDDRRKFLEHLADVVQWSRLECSAYCLMNNHYHLVIRTLEPNLSRAIRNLNGSYAQWWNLRHRHVGHVFQGRFNAQIVQDEGYFVTACRYVVLNPVRARLVNLAEDWAWSSYRATAGLTSAPGFLDDALLLRQFCDEDARHAAESYRRYVAAAVDGAAGSLQPDPILGEATFVARFKAWRERASKEVPCPERSEPPSSLDAIFAGAFTRAMRTRQALEAYRMGYSMIAIATHLGIHYGTVSKMIRTAKGVRSRKKMGSKT